MPNRTKADNADLPAQPKAREPDRRAKLAEFVIILSCENSPGITPILVKRLPDVQILKKNTGKQTKSPLPAGAAGASLGSRTLKTRGRFPEQQITEKPVVPQADVRIAFRQAAIQSLGQLLFDRVAAQS